MMQTMTITKSSKKFIFAVEGQEQRVPLTKKELLNVLAFAKQTEDVIMEKLIEDLAKDDVSPLYENTETQSVVVPHLPFTFSNDDMSMITAVIHDALGYPTIYDETNVEQIIRIQADAEKMFAHLDFE
jgi:hypothetical protein